MHQQHTIPTKSTFPSGGNFDPQCSVPPPYLKSGNRGLWRGIPEGSCVLRAERRKAKWGEHPPPTRQQRHEAAKPDSTEPTCQTRATCEGPVQGQGEPTSPVCFEPGPSHASPQPAHPEGGGRPGAAGAGGQGEAHCPHPDRSSPTASPGWQPHGQGLGLCSSHRGWGRAGWGGGG